MRYDGAAPERGRREGALKHKREERGNKSRVTIKVFVYLERIRVTLLVLNASAFKCVIMLSEILTTLFS